MDPAGGVAEEGMDEGENPAPPPHLGWFLGSIMGGGMRPKVLVDDME